MNKRTSLLLVLASVMLFSCKKSETLINEGTSGNNTISKPYRVKQYISYVNGIESEKAIFVYSGDTLTEQKYYSYISGEWEETGINRYDYYGQNVRINFKQKEGGVWVDKYELFHRFSYGNPVKESYYIVDATWNSKALTKERITEYKNSNKNKQVYLYYSNGVVDTSKMIEYSYNNGELSEESDYRKDYLGNFVKKYKTQYSYIGSETIKMNYFNDGSDNWETSSKYITTTFDNKVQNYKYYSWNSLAQSWDLKSTTSYSFTNNETGYTEVMTSGSSRKVVEYEEGRHISTGLNDFWFN